MRVVVIGAGAAGMVAAREAARRSAEVLLLEKNNKTGVKILMSGGTRCNITHDTDARGITTEFGHARRFLQPSVGAFPPNEVIEMFNQAGVATKVEDTGKIFPQSDRALQVRDALHRMAIDEGVNIRLGTAVVGVQQPSEAGSPWRVMTERETIECDRLIVTAGGRSWPGCGTTGDAYQWLSSLGHTIVPTRPALVPLVGGYSWTHELSGLALEDSLASVLPTRGKAKPLKTRRGAWLFTHFGFSGPTPMDVSGTITGAASLKDVALTLDLVPSIDEATIQSALTDRSHNGGRQKVRSVIGQWLPNRLADALIAQVGSDQPIAELPRAKQLQLIQMIKRLPLPINGTRGFAKAEVTAGGVALSEVNPKTMASRIATGLFIAGEVLDVDGPIGGFNFQAAFSTGRAAGAAAVNSE
ncbi:MAG: NAD(P)/FAD-dependent oxidoreductase [Rubripirellula sp.]